MNTKQITKIPADKLTRGDLVVIPGATGPAIWRVTRVEIDGNTVRFHADLNRVIRTFRAPAAQYINTVQFINN